MPLTHRLSRLHEYVLVALATLFLRLSLFFWAGFAPENWVKWDAVHYINLARFGYHTTSLPPDRVAFMARFPPLYSFLVRMVAELFRVSLPISGIALSLLFTSITSVILYHLLWQRFRLRGRAWLGVLFLNLFPTAYFSNAPFSEPLFLLCLALYFLSLNRKDDLILPGIAAAFALLTKTLGVVLFPVHLFCFERYRRNRPLRLKDYLGLAIPFVAFFTHQLILYFYIHGPNYLAHAFPSDATFGKNWPFQETVQALIAMVKNPSSVYQQSFMFTLGWNSLFMVGLVLLTLWGMKKLPWEYGLFLITFVLFMSLMGWNISLLRYTFTAFPIYLLLASIESPVLSAGLLFGFALCQLQFARVFVSGSWAF